MLINIENILKMIIIAQSSIDNINSSYLIVLPNKFV